MLNQPLEKSSVASGTELFVGYVEGEMGYEIGEEYQVCSDMEVFGPIGSFFLKYHYVPNNIG